MRSACPGFYIPESRQRRKKRRHADEQDDRNRAHRESVVDGAEVLQREAGLHVEEVKRYETCEHTHKDPENKDKYGRTK